jgi:hypothetical protein
MVAETVMRIYLLAIPAALAAAPAVAAQPSQDGPIAIPPELADPAFIDRIARMSDALSKALVDLPVGEIEAAAEGRPVTDADRQRTVGDVARISSSDVEREIAEARPKVQAATQAFARALPAITRALSEAADEIQRATANMPRPDYPRR